MIKCRILWDQMIGALTKNDKGDEQPYINDWKYIMYCVIVARKNILIAMLTNNENKDEQYPNDKYNSYCTLCLWHTFMSACEFIIIN